MRRNLLLAALLILVGVLWMRRAAVPPVEGVALPTEPTSARDASAPTLVAPPEAAAESQRQALPSASHGENEIVLEGRVVDVVAGMDPTLATPAVGATVSAGLDSFAGLGQEDAGSSTTSGPEGSFRIVLADDGKRPLALLVEVEADERFRSAFTRCRLDEGEKRRAGLLLTREEHGGLPGRTIDRQGRPVPGVEIFLTSGAEGETPASATSDEEGEFLVENARDFRHLEVRKEGFTLLEAKLPGRVDGRWEPMEVVLCGEGTLRVHVADPAGDPVSGAQITVAIAQPERFGASKSWETLRTDRRAESDSSGTAVFQGVWADQRLLVFAFLGTPLQFERVERDRLVLVASEGSEPLFLTPGSERDVHLELGGRFRIFGRVLDERGNGLDQPWVCITALDRPRTVSDRLQQVIRGDAEGSFELELSPLRPLGRVLVTAMDAQGPPVFGVGKPSVAVSTVLDFTGRTSGEEELTLIVAPTLAIAGRIVSDPPVTSAMLRIHARSDVLPFGSMATGVHGFGQAARGGAFRIGGLPPGRYDLEVSPSSPFATVWVRDVEAGTEDLTIPIDAKRPVRVTVEVTSEDGELGEVILLTGRLRPHDEEAEAPELPNQASYRAPSGWPPAMLELWSGGGGSTDELGWTQYSLVQMSENPMLLELDEGLYWIGAKSRAKDGNYSFPIGTGLVHLSAGEYRLRFELTPGGSVEGRVTGGTPGRELFAALVRDGELLTLDVGRDDMHSMAELGMDGFFRFPLVPAGEVELRVGTREELLGDRWTHREVLQLARGAALFIDVSL